MHWLASWESFVKAVEDGSMAAAARRIGCTRARVSKQIGELERDFGARLFERRAHRLSLTPAGEVFYQHAVRALEAVASTEIAVRNLGDTPHGLLRVSASITFGRMYVAPLLPQLTGRYPELECELILTDQLVDLVDDHIDLALRHTRAPPEDAVARKLVAIRRVLCATPAYLVAHGEPEQPRDLGRHQCFAYPQSGDGQVIWLAGRDGEEISVPIGSRFRFNNLDCVLAAALAGHGVAMLPTYLCGPEIRSGRLRTVLEGHEPLTGFGSHVYACYTPSRVRLPKVKVLLDQLERLLTPVPPWESPAAARGGATG
ncbi:LysR family transcriptional regulator [Accumulibacter sp.]|uniref:LysR family transcriptional regulator n=1 Tax=Accumulibacter sp. TaxID=2053492 RepID=UPI0025F83CCA|nr:LysR family transcriptional regulator [Accumulibacter sp.]MCM8613668.1 LysR family transcriptional regulator [Accumulibacter sp.]MCM8637304.1 LysR family transcriptional regulator [Accumulibacter sp.]MCM8638212.1 LysR family transcriptional regulator [Accumulibacter sp.]